jgi:hypothetical protein
MKEKDNVKGEYKLCSYKMDPNKHSFLRMYAYQNSITMQSLISEIIDEKINAIHKEEISKGKVDVKETFDLKKEEKKMLFGIFGKK